MSFSLPLTSFDKKVLSLALLMTATFFSLPMLAAEAPAKEATCRACHGDKGAAPIMDSYPKLNGQNQAYLVQALKDYQSGNRSGGMAVVMTGQANLLSEEDIKLLAAYYAAQ